MAFDCLMLSIFDIESDCLRNSQSDYLQLYNNYISCGPVGINRFYPRFCHYLPFPNLRKLHKSASELRIKIKEIIQQRKIKSDTSPVTCFLDYIIDSLNGKEIEDNVYNFITGGHETTTNSLTWGVHFLANNADVQEKVRAEVDGILGGKVPEHGDLNKFKYLDMVMKENLRHATPTIGLVPRVAKMDTQIENVTIRKNDWVNINLYALHHHPDFWENPYKYDPERFSEEKSKGRHPYSYMPFSYGRRSCIGNNFSLTEQKLVLIMLLQKYKIHPVTTNVKMGRFFFRAPLNVEIKLSPRST